MTTRRKKVPMGKSKVPLGKFKVPLGKLKVPLGKPKVPLGTLPRGPEARGRGKAGVAPE